MDHSPCSHISEYRSLQKGSSNPFLSLKECLQFRPPGRPSIRRDPSELPRCSLCLSVSRLYACLSCASLSCVAHAPSHALAVGGFHALAVDVDRAELFCCVCRDQVYDRDFDAAVVSAQAGPRAENPEKLRKRRRVDYRSWAPDLRERTLIGKNATPLTPSGFPWGLRGLNNLGNTCFMNSVLQALLHTPPLRNYFLSDRHNRFYCQQQKNGVKKNDTSCDKKSRVCLACDMDAMFSAVFSGDRMPYSPAKFLYRSISSFVFP